VQSCDHDSAGGVNEWLSAKANEVDTLLLKKYSRTVLPRRINYMEDSDASPLPTLRRESRASG